MKIAARRVLSMVFALALIAGWSALGSTAASAEVVHDFDFSFTGNFLGGLGTVALDQANGDLYAEDYQAGILRFGAGGEYLGQIPAEGLFYYYSGVAVDNSAGPNKGDLYVAGTQNGIVYKFDSSGKLLSELNGSGTPAGSFSPRGVAVDSSGDLYVADAANGVVDKFDASGKYISQIASLDIGGSTASIAVDSSGNLYINNFLESTVKLEPDGTASVLDAGKTTSVAVDPATNDIYVAEEESPNPGRIAEYNTAGKRLGAFGEEHLGSIVDGIAVRGTTGEVYAADYVNELIDVFGPAVVIPDVTTQAASTVQPSGATLNGSVNPAGVQVTSCQFEYGTASSYGQSVPCSQSPVSIGSGTSPVAVSTDVSGLQPDTEYHFRLDATNANGTNRGADMTFTTTGSPRIDGESATGVTHTAAALRAQIDPFGFDTTYHFEYGPSTSYGTSVPVPDADIGAGMGDVAVSQGISGLQAGVTYHYRVVAVSSQGTVDGSDQTLMTVPPAFIDGAWASNVAATSATLNTKVDPLGTSTAYRLEYGTSAAYGQALAGNVGEGESDVLVTDHLQELQPGTTYHYRVVTTNTLGTVEDPDHTFITQAAGGQELTLPDGRAWELVSPPNKGGALIELLEDDPIQAASDGSGITYEVTEPIGEEPKGKARYSQTLSTRVSGGWRSRDIDLPHPLADNTVEQSIAGYDYLQFSSDLSVAAVQQRGPLFQLSPEATEGRVYLRNDAEGSFQALLTATDVLPGTKLAESSDTAGQELEFVGGTPDLSHAILGSEFQLTAEGGGLYEWSAGQLRSVGILPDGTTGAALLAGDHKGENYSGSAPRAMSNDGRWVAFTSEGGLYVRDMVEKKTVQIGGDGAGFQTMSADGSNVIFMQGGELFEADSETGVQVDLTADHGAGEGNAGVKNSILGASEDGSYVYFVATGVLGGASGAIGGEDNLYVAHDNGSKWTTGYIATLSSEDEHDWSGNIGGDLERRHTSSRVSPNGRYLAFMSERSLTGYDNRDAGSGQPDEEVYLYDAAAGRLLCASCDPTGARPVGIFDTGTNVLMDRVEGSPISTWSGHWVAGMISSWDAIREEHPLYQPRFLSDSGRLFFDSPDALVPQDTNGLMDAYEYEPAGIGSCEVGNTTFNEGSDGCVSPISSGTSSAESAFFDASENGDDVFFLTASQLTPEDHETSLSVYDAHVCTAAVPCVRVPVSPPPCTSGDSCKAAPSPQPEVFGPPPSATFSGAGNVAEEPTQSVVKRRAKPKAKHKHKTRPRRTAGKRTAGKKGRKAGRANGARTGTASRKGYR